MEDEKQKLVRKLRQIEEHARALTHELAAGEAQNRARLIRGLAAHLILTRELQETNPAGAPGEGASLLRLPPR